MSERIKVGDRVAVYWEQVKRLEGTVVYIPCGPGDSWVIETGGYTEDGAPNVSHVQAFCRMDRL